MVSRPIINELEISKFEVNSGGHTLRPAPTVKENECFLIVVKLFTKSVWPLFLGHPALIHTLKILRRHIHIINDLKVVCTMYSGTPIYRAS